MMAGQVGAYIFRETIAAIHCDGKHSKLRQLQEGHGDDRFGAARLRVETGRGPFLIISSALCLPT